MNTLPLIVPSGACPPNQNLGVWMILFCASDLIWATKIKSTADSLGLPCRPVRNLDMLEARLGDSPVRSLIVDLESGEAAIQLVQRLRDTRATAAHKSIRILAFGPHVGVEALQAAKHAGADEVMPRGAFSARLPNILQELAAMSPPGA